MAGTVDDSTINIVVVIMITTITAISLALIPDSVALSYTAAEAVGPHT